MKEFEGKKLLILGGIQLICDIVVRAQKMGIYVIVADYLTDSPAKKIADKAVLINALDVDALEAFCIEEKVDGVTTGFIDILLEPCYELCKRLGIPCYLTPKMIEMSTNKISFKNACNKYKVPVPQTYLVGSEISDDIYSRITYPVFVKPLDSSGSRGASVCNNKIELEIQFEKAKSFSPTNNVVVEDYLNGREFLLNYIAYNGTFRVVSMFDRYTCSDRGSAINYSNLAYAPSNNILNLLDNINPFVENMFKSEGFMDGVYFMQGYAKDGKITFFEMGCRLGGSYYDLENACIGVDPVECTIRYALTGTMITEFASIPYDVADYKKNAICINYLLNCRKAEINKICGLDEISSNPVCISYEQRYFEGDKIQDDRIVDRPIVCLNIVEDSFDAAVDTVNTFNKKFKVCDSRNKNLLMSKFELNNIDNAKHK